MATPARTEAAGPLDRLAYGLRGHLNRFSHVVINVSDLARAVEFYESAFPVKRRQRLNGPAQRYAGLGIEHGQFEGWVMENIGEGAPPGNVIAEFPARFIHLVQWKTPGPVGTPYREANHVGIYRQNSIVADVNERYSRVQALGGRPYGEPSWIVLTPDGRFGVWVFAFRDPDGNTLEMMSGPPAAAKTAFPGVTHHCNLNVRNLERSNRFYRDLIGLDLHYYLAPAGQPAGNGSLGDLLRNPDGTPYTGSMEFAATLLGLRSDTRNPLDVLEWKVPQPYGEAYREANHLGIVRVAIEVDDIAAAHARLAAAGHAPLGPVETWDLGEGGRRKVLILRDPDGIMLELIEQLPYLGEQPPFG